MISGLFTTNTNIPQQKLPASIYLFNVNNKDIRKRCEIVKYVNWHRSGIFIVNFEHILQLFLVLLLLTLKK